MKTAPLWRLGLLWALLALCRVGEVVSNEAVATEHGAGAEAAAGEAANATAEAGHEASEHTAHTHEDYPVVLHYFLVALMIGMFTFKVINTLRLPVPYTVTVFVEGFLLGVLHFESGAKLGALSESIDKWVNIDPHLLLYTLLPILIFGDAMKLNFEVVKGCAKQCLLLAGPGVVMGAVLTALFAQYVLPYNWDFTTALCFGSILSATDPVAVVGLLNELGCSKVLSMQIAGESLLNDGTAMVLWSVAFNMMKGEEYTAPSLTGFFFQLAGGGFAMGIFWGSLCLYCIARSADQFSHHDTVMQVALTVVAAYSAFYFSEHEVHCSGILATVFAALVVARMAWAHIIDDHSMHSFWHMVEFFANTIIFFLAGTVISEAVVHRTEEVSAADWGWLALLYVALLLIRIIMVVLFYPLLARLGFGTNWKDCTVIVWGGLRGAVGLALALSVDAQFGGKVGSLFLFHCGGIALLTLVINAPTCKGLLGRLGMTRRNWAEEDMIEHLKFRQAHKTYELYQTFARTDKRFLQLHHKLMHDWVSALGEFKLEVEQQGMAITGSQLPGHLPGQLKTEVHAKKREKKHHHNNVVHRKTNLAGVLMTSMGIQKRDSADKSESINLAGLDSKKDDVLHHASTFASDCTSSTGVAARMSCARINNEAIDLHGHTLAFKGQSTQDLIGHTDTEDRNEYQKLASQIKELGEKDETESALMDEREFFYAAVRAEYNAFLKEGLLPRRSRTVTLLLAAVDFGEAHCDEPICDWDKVMMSMSCGHNVESKFRASCMKWWRDFRDGTLVGKVMLPVHRRNATFDLLTVVTFIDAHVCARQKIQETIENSPIQLHKAMLKVFHESQLQVSEAQEFIAENRIGQDMYALVRTFQLSMYLLLKQQVMVHEWVQIGAITEGDSHELLHDVEHDFAIILNASKDLTDSGYQDDHSDEPLVLSKHRLCRISKVASDVGRERTFTGNVSMASHNSGPMTGVSAILGTRAPVVASGRGRLRRYSQTARASAHPGTPTHSQAPLGHHTLADEEVKKRIEAITGKSKASDADDGGHRPRTDTGPGTAPKKALHGDGASTGADKKIRIRITTDGDDPEDDLIVAPNQTLEAGDDCDLPADLESPTASGPPAEVHPPATSGDRDDRGEAGEVGAEAAAKKKKRKSSKAKDKLDKREGAAEVGAGQPRAPKASPRPSPRPSPPDSPRVQSGAEEAAGPPPPAPAPEEPFAEKGSLFTE